jgi:ubiquinone/menaquinone biosynthesis C-methylase UbiE
MNVSLSRNAPRVDRWTVHSRQTSAWAGGQNAWNYAADGNALQLVSEELCETMNLYQQARVLDVSAGNGHASLAAARRWCDVTCTDSAPDLSNRHATRLEARNLGVRFVEGDAEALPFSDQSFDVVLSTFGAMFALDQDRASAELIRVCRRGGCVGLANWTPEGFIGELFRLVGRHSNPTGGNLAPFEWGTSQCLARLFGAYGRIETIAKNVAFRSRTPAEWVDRFRASYAPASGPAALADAGRQRALRGDLLELVCRFNRAKDGSMVVDAQYLEVVITRR